MISSRGISIVIYISLIIHIPIQGFSQPKKQNRSKPDTISILSLKKYAAVATFFKGKNTSQLSIEHSSIQEPLNSPVYGLILTFFAWDSVEINKLYSIESIPSSNLNWYCYIDSRNKFTKFQKIQGTFKILKINLSEIYVEFNLGALSIDRKKYLAYLGTQRFSVDN